MSTYAVDFDGTLHDWHHIPDGHKLGPPTPGALQFMSKIAAEPNARIGIFTVRGGQSYVHAWLRYWKIPYNFVTNIKFPADYYIDDHAVRFDGNWNKVYVETHRGRS